MADVLTLTGQMHLSSVQHQFTELFPHLGLVFFSQEEHEKTVRGEKAVPMKTDLTVASVRTKKGDDISLHGKWLTKNFEKAFVDGYGLYVQVCIRTKDGKASAYTSAELDNLTLRSLEDKAAENGFPKYVY